MKTVQYKIIIFTILAASFTSCEDFVQVPPPETLFPGEKVFESDATALSALANLYSNMNGTSDFSSGGRSSISFLMGAAADELVPVSGSSSDIQSFYLNEVLPEAGAISQLWGNLYNLIYLSNNIIEGSTNSQNLTSEVKAQLEGEAKFIRAFCHFYLVNLFGDIPYVKSTDYRANSKVSRMSESAVYNSIIEDLLDAKQLLKDNYPSDGHVRPNNGTVNAMLARVYLYTGEWANAEIQATSVINSSLYSLMPIDQVFIKESTEAIWQIYPQATAMNSFDAETFIISETPQWSVLSDELATAFEVGDIRKNNWIGTTNDGTNTFNFPYKYKMLPSDSETEYSVVLRLSEQYLIRAEARARQDELEEAISDLDVIRLRAELPLIADTNPSISKEDLLLAIEQERRVELFTEWGHRWFDLKRSNHSDGVLGLIKPSWQNTDILLPVPASEILKNNNLAPQNSGY